MKLFKNLLLFVCALTINSTYAQNLMNIHQGNGTLLQIPLESIDSVRFYTIPPPTIQKIFQSNGNILSIAVSDIDSITYTIPNSAALASISTQAVTVLSSSSAYSGGTITSDGGSAITQRGVCWSTSPNPTLANNFSMDGTGIGSFGSNILPLQAATTYYVRSYAVNSEGTAYGNQITFTTSNPSTSGSLATISTANVIYTDGLTATCGGNITADGGLAVTSRGVCWAIGTTPTISNNITINGAGGGSYTSTLTNLLPNTSYFVRAYATNDAGTSYGITYSFTTFALPTVITTIPTSISGFTAISGGVINNDGGSSIIQKGVCWSILPMPTISNNLLQNGNGNESYSSYIIGLMPSTTYYVRSYATNGVGTSYGNEIVLSTINPYGNDITYNGHSYNTIIVGNGQEWMAENLTTEMYQNGDPILTDLDNNTWGNLTNVGAFAIQNNDDANNVIYGKLYNWYAVADTRNICPVGWHVPTAADWTLLINYLDGPDYAGGKMKAYGNDYWIFNNTASNESGFSALPGGCRINDGTTSGIGNFFNIGGAAYFWSSTQTPSDGAWSYNIGPWETIIQANGNLTTGNSVRCVKD